MTADLVAFLRARLDEDEHDARAAQLRAPTPWRSESWDVTVPDGSALADANGDGVAIARGDCLRAHLVRHDPARVLAEVNTKRSLLDYLADLERKALDGNWWNLDTSQPIKLLTVPYADHPDYRPEWAPDA